MSFDFKVDLYGKVAAKVPHKKVEEGNKFKQEIMDILQKRKKVLQAQVQVREEIVRSSALEAGSKKAHEFYASPSGKGHQRGLVSIMLANGLHLSLDGAKKHSVSTTEKLAKKMTSLLFAEIKRIV